MVRPVDRLSERLGCVAGWLYFAAGMMILWEVGARYLFAAPTIWAEELSRLAFIWASFLPLATLFRQRAHIGIQVLVDRLGPAQKKWAEVFSTAFTGLFAATAAWYGWDIAYDSFVVGRTTGTMMNIPNWWFEASVPLCFALLAAQCLTQIVMLILGKERPPPTAGNGS